MNFKKKTFILSIFFIFVIQVLLLINNKPKTSFRYFIWNIQEISIGRLIFISFLSGLFMSYTLNKTSNNNMRDYPVNQQVDKKTDENDYSINHKENNESFEMPPERDLRDTQPTISVNYRVVKDNSENERKDKNMTSEATQYNDDWDKKDSEW